MSKDKSSQMFNLKLLVMKKMKLCFLVLLASFILVIQSFGQSNQSDSVKTNLNLSSEVIKKLDSKDIVEIVKYKEKFVQERLSAEKFAVDPSKIIGKFIPIMPIIFFTFILLVLTIPFYFNFRKTKGRQLIINNLIEKGQEIPIELIVPAKRNLRTDLHKGIILIFFGLSISVVLLSIKIPVNFNLWTLGLIPLFIGLGYLISFKLDKSNINKSEKE